METSVYEKKRKKEGGKHKEKEEEKEEIIVGYLEVSLKTSWLACPYLGLLYTHTYLPRYLFACLPE
jgi:hypothetical protein